MADAAGRGQLTASTATASAAGTNVALGPELLLDGDHVLDLHDATSSALVACGGVPRAAGAPTQLPRTGWPGPLASIALGAVTAGAGLALRRARAVTRTRC